MPSEDEGLFSVPSPVPLTASESDDEEIGSIYPQETLATETTGSQMATKTRRKQEPVSTAGGLEWASQSQWESTPQSYKLRSWPCSSVPKKHRSTVIEGTSEFARIAGLL